MIDRQEIVDELILREQIRKIIRIVKERKRKEETLRLNEEKELRSIIRKIILSEGTINPVDSSPRSGSTVENALELLFRDTREAVLQAYQVLAEPEERKGFFAGFLAGLRNRYDEFDGITDVPGEEGQKELKEDIDIEIEEEDTPQSRLFIPGEEEPKEEPEEESPPVLPPEEATPFYKFGYNNALDLIDDTNVATQNLETYEQFTKVGDQERANNYRDWAIINYGLHMANTEEEITGVYPELPAEFAAEMEKFETARAPEDPGPPEEEIPSPIPGAEEEAFEFEG